MRSAAEFRTVFKPSPDTPTSPRAGSLSSSMRIATSVAAALAALFAALAVVTPMAEAGKSIDRIVAGSASSGTGAGEFNQARGVAVNYESIADNTTDPTGDSTDSYLYVADSSNHRIQVFSPDGQFRFMWGRGVLDGTDAPQVCDREDASCTGATSFSGVQGGMFNNPQGIAINQDTGDVFVRDSGNRRVQQFEADGTFVKAWGWGVATAAAAFEVCTAAASCQAGRVDQAEGNGNGGQLAADSGLRFGDAPTGIAVSPLSGHVLVVDPGNRRVQEFDPAGVGSAVFVRLWGWDVVSSGQSGDVNANSFEICTSANIGVCKVAAGGGSEHDRPVGRFSSGRPRHVTVGSDGVVYTDNIGAAANGSLSMWRVDSFNSAAATPAALPRSTFVVHDVTGQPASQASAVVDLDVDVSTENLLLGRSDVAPNGVRDVLEFADQNGVSHVDTHVSGMGGGAVTGRIAGVAADPDSGDLLVTAANRLFAADDDGAPPALMSVEPPSDVSSRGASLNGVVNSNGSLGTAWRLQVSRNGADWSTVENGFVPAGFDDVAVSGQATDLRPNTLYLARLVTNKEFGSPDVVSVELTFRTHAVPPELASVRADAVQDTTVRLSGRVNPHSTQTSYRFEWGQGNFFNVAPVPDGPVGAGPDFVFVSTQLSGLEPDTTYQFRLVGTSATEGPTTSATRTFTTRAVATGDQARGLELVSPPDKVGAVGLGWWYNGLAATGPSGMAAYSGERFAVNSHNGGTLLDGSPMALANEVALSERVDDQVGWRSHPSVAWAAVRSQQYRNATPNKGASDDLSLIGWRSNGGLLAPFPEMHDWTDAEVNNPLFVSDWAGRWELCGPTDPGQLGSAGDAVADSVVAAGGRYVLMNSGIRGLAGNGDPSVDMDPRGSGGARTVYLCDYSAGVSNSFPGAATRSLVHVCTADTVLPARTEVSGVFKLSERDCDDPDSGRDAALVSAQGAAILHRSSGSQAHATDRIISRDGSRVFFMSPDPATAGVPSTGCTGVGDATVCPAQLFVRQRNDDGSVVTRWISRSEIRADGDVPGSEDQAASLAGQAIFEGASDDGSRVFFRTNSPLTADDPNGQALSPTDPRPVLDGTPSNNSWDLYMFELAPGSDPTGPGSKLIRITAGPTGDGDCNSPFGGAGAVGGLRFVSADGHRAYFTCAAPLPGVPESADATRTTSPGGTPTTSNASNLYMYSDRGDDPQWRFVARLPRATGSDPAACATTSERQDMPFTGVGGTGGPNFDFSAGRCVFGKSDGSFVTLWTGGRLTVDDPDGSSMDIYGYDADTDELVRITASQGGVGGSYPCGTAGSAAQRSCHGDPGMQGNNSLLHLGVATDPLVAGDKVAFFQSKSRLVPEDVDDAYDVYEWRNGELSLASSGMSSTDGAFYKGNDRTGRNVYMVTRDRMTWQDYDAVLDAYTARIDGGIPQPPSPTVCDVLAGGCQGAGIGKPVSVVPQSDTVEVGGNASPAADERPAVHKRLRVGNLSRKVRRRAAHGGVLPVRVMTSRAGIVRVLARAKVGKRTRLVAGRKVRAHRAGVVTVRLSLNRAARIQLRRGRALRVTLQVASPGARTRTATVHLKRGRQS